MLRIFVCAYKVNYTVLPNMFLSVLTTHSYTKLAQSPVLILLGRIENYMDISKHWSSSAIAISFPLNSLYHPNRRVYSCYLRPFCSVRPGQDYRYSGERLDLKAFPMVPFRLCS